MKRADRFFFCALTLLTMTSVLAVAGATPAIRAALQAAVFALLTLRALQKALAGDRLHVAALSLPPACMALWAWVQSRFGLEATQADSLYAMLYWAQIGAFLLLTSDILPDDRTIAWFRDCLLWFTVCLAVAAVASHQFSGNKMWGLIEVPGSRPMGSFVNPNHFTTLIGLVLPIALWKTTARGGSPMAFLAVAVLAGSVIVSASRAGGVIVMAELLVVPWVAAGQRLRPVVWRRVTALWLCAAAGIAISGWSVLSRRLQEQNVFKYRREIFLSTIDMWREHPWTGVGLGGFETVYPGYARFDTRLRVDHAHNDWLEWLAEGGVPATVCLVAFIAMCVPALRGRPWTWGLGAVVAHAAVDFPLQIPGVLIPTLGLAAAAWSSQRLTSQAHCVAREPVILYRWLSDRMNKPPPETAIEARQRPSMRLLASSLKEVPTAATGNSHSSLVK